jgi:hypothetical protein
VTDNQAQQAYDDGLTMLFNQCRILAMLPLEDMLTALNHAEAIGPFIDPTLYREYLSTKNGAVIKELLKAALAVKRIVLKNQPQAEATK